MPRITRLTALLLLPLVAAAAQDDFAFEATDRAVDSVLDRALDKLFSR